jgi:iron-sulfur cluster repair protein YtfE (RIC family)
MSAICHAPLPRVSIHSHAAPATRAAPAAPAPAGVDSGEAHPTAATSPAEIVDHLIHCHHRTLRQRLLWVESLIDKAAAEHHASDTLSSLARSFAELHDELDCCLLQERCAILPAFAKGQPDDEPGLREAVRAIGKTHAHLLQRFWTLTAGVSELSRATDGRDAADAIAAELSDLVDDYYQHLFEEECLLFPRLAALGRLAASAGE